MMKSMNKIRTTDVNIAYRNLIRSNCQHNFLIVGIGKQDDTKFVLSLWCSEKCHQQININLNLIDMMKQQAVQAS